MAKGGPERRHDLQASLPPAFSVSAVRNSNMILEGDRSSIKMTVAYDRRLMMMMSRSQDCLGRSVL